MESTVAWLAAKRFPWYNLNVSFEILTPSDVAQEVERLTADSGFGYVHVIVADGRIDRIDRCVQIKAARPSKRRSRLADLHLAAERD